MTIGKILEFNVRSGNWTLYVERAEMYFKVNEINKELWLPTLIAAMGDEAYELLSNLTSPVKPSDKNYAIVTQMMKDHLQPKPSFMAERYRFRQRRQQVGESIAQYISELKKLARYWEFGAVLEENLRDQLVCGLSSETIRQRVFTEENLEYAKAVKISCAMEAAERDAAAVERAGGSEITSGSAGGTDVHYAGNARRGRGTSGRGGGGGGVRPSRSRGQNAGSDNGGNNTDTCKACGGFDHRVDDCQYNRYICGKCRQRGHLRKVCPLRETGAKVRRTGAGNGGGGGGLLAHVDQELRTHLPGADESPTEDDESEIEEDLYQLCLNGYKPVSLSINIDGINIPMEVDTGSLVSCISKKMYDKYFNNRTLQESNLVFKFYNGAKIRPLGVIKPAVSYGKVSKSLELFVIEGGTTSLLGRQWLSELKIRIHTLFKNVVVTEDRNDYNKDLMSLLSRYKDLFTDGLGRFRGGAARLRVREGATPVFCRARAVPYALRDRVDEELEAMLRTGVIEPVDSADWATPLVPVRKADGGLRICADYKVTLNPVLLIDRYPLPRIDDLLVNLNGAKVLSKIDLSQAYNQIELDDPDNLTVINTHKGLFKYKRLVYGLSSSPGIFQRIMSNLLKDIPNVQVFLDDIIIGSTSITQHLDTLEKLFERLHSSGIKLKKNKCFFMTNEVKYLGFIISANGIKADPDKVEGILNIPHPRNITELRSFLGTINFYAKFVNNLSTILAPLYNLLKKGNTWKWDKECELACNKVKSILTSVDVLAHYDPNKPLFLTCDASARGLGGVLTQLCEGDGAGAGGGRGTGPRERPVIYVSRALTSAEKNYSQIEREALAIVFSLEKLHQYLYGRRFTLRTDHKPLVTIFGPKHGVPTMAASRLQRWAIKLTAYTYDIEFVGSKDNGADGLSRLPARSLNKQRTKMPEQTFLHFAQNAVLMDYLEIKKQTSRDPLLGRVLSYLRDEWPSDDVITSLKPYYNRKNELYEELGCVMWGYRVVVPETCRSRVLSELHEAHMGIVKTKAFARSYVWWPGMDEAIETMCRTCCTCAAEADAPPRHLPCPWPWPDKPWARVHLDFLGPINGRIFLVMVDARTKWIEVSQVPSTAASHTINRLSEVFARFGLPRQVVSDNGPPFTSSEFSQFLSSNGVEHLFSAPYHPASNGAAENAVRTVKRVIKKAFREKLDVTLFLNTYLLHYRNTEHCTTGETPALLMYGRKLRTKLDSLRPDRNAKVRNAQQNQQQTGSASGSRDLRPGDKIWLRQYRGGNRWVQGKVAEKIGAEVLLLMRHVQLVQTFIMDWPSDTTRTHMYAHILIHYNITIFGESVGGSAVSLHAISPMSKGLFKRAIALSGVFLNDFFVSFEHRRRAFLFTQQLGLYTQDPAEALNFLQCASVESLVKTKPFVYTFEKPSNDVFDMFPFTPVVEIDYGCEHFLTEDPEKLLKEGKTNNVDLILGNKVNEGVYNVYTQKRYILEYYPIYRELFVPLKIVNVQKPTKVLELGDRIQKHYFGNKQVGKETMDEFLTFYSYFLYIYDIHRYVEMWIKGGNKAYFYEFSGYDENDTCGRCRLNYDEHKAKGQEDVTYIFGGEDFRSLKDKKKPSYNILVRTCTLCANYAKYGNPTPDCSLGAIWTDYSQNNSYLDMGQKLTAKYYDNRPHIDFWRSIFDSAGLKFS